MKLRLKEICEQTGVTRAQIEEKTGLKKGYLSDLFNSKCNPTVETLEKIANAIGVDIRELFPKSEHDVLGFIEIRGVVYRVTSFEDLENILKLKQ